MRFRVTVTSVHPEIRADLAQLSPAHRSERLLTLAAIGLTALRGTMSSPRQAPVAGGQDGTRSSDPSPKANLTKLRGISFSA
ncbi:MAG: hypothetical protein ACYDHY_15355 [Acidiferrobacterales bacterium]